MRTTCLLSLLALLAGPSLAEDKPKKKTNRLARETSPYLLQHSHNPVDWFAWGEEAFAKAKNKEQKEQVLKQADKLAEETTTLLAGTRLSPLFEIKREQVDEAVEAVVAMADKKYGGFGSAEREFRGPKFPMPARLLLLEEEA